MAKLTPKEEAEILESLKAQFELRSKLNSSVDDYITALKDIKNLQDNIHHIDDTLQQQLNKKLLTEQKLAKAKAAGSNASQQDIDDLEEQLILENEILDIIEKQLTLRKKEVTVLANAAREVNKGKMALVSIGKELANMPNLIERGYGKIKGLGLFDLDKSMKKSALQMGILSKQTEGFRSNIKSASFETNQIGVGVDQLAEMQAGYSTELGRIISLSDKANVSMAELAKGTNLGAEGASEMAASMNNIGYSIDRTSKYIESALNDAHKMGVNASKVIKNVQNGIKLLNNYKFKDGESGLKRMAATAAKFGTEMNFAANLADKLMNIEGAVEVSAQLQVLGGAWAKLADPFKLMYLAQNDMEGLNDAVVEAAASTAKFNSETKSFDISSLNMKILRQVAEQTGLSYDELAKSAKNAAQFTKIKSQIKISTDKDTKEFISNISELDEKGNAKITIDGDTKLVTALNNNDIVRLDAIKKEKQGLNERAKQARSFDETLTNTLNQFKTILLPIVDSINGMLTPLVDKLVNNPDFKKNLTDLGNKIGDFLTGAIKFVKPVLEFVANNPIKSIAVAILGSQAAWIANGFFLAKGFNLGASVGGGGSSSIPGSLLSSLGGKNAFGGKLAMGTAGSMAAGAGLGIAGMGLDYARSRMDDPNDGWGKAAGIGSSTLTGAGMGMMFGPWGAAIGGLLGGIYGAVKEFGADAPGVNKPINDGIYSQGKITPIDNKDSLLAYKPDGPIDERLKGKSTNNSSGNMNITFSPIKIEFGEIKLTSSGGPSVTIPVLNDSNFIRELTRTIMEQLTVNVNMGKLNPNPS